MARALPLVAVLLALSALDGGAAHGGDAPAPGAGASSPPAAPGAPAPAGAATAKPPTPALAADAVLAAVTAEDEAALAALARRDDPDPWLVVDELVRRGALDPADAFAKASPRPDTEALPAYVGSRRSVGDDREARERLDRAYAALRARDLEAAVSSLGAPREEEVDDVVAVRSRSLLASLLDRRGRPAEASAAHGEASAAAERLGWLLRAGEEAHAAGASALDARDDGAARRAYERAVSVHARRGDRAREARSLGALGNTHAGASRYAEALVAYGRSLALREAAEDEIGVATILGAIGLVHHRRGDHARALELHRRALTVHERLGDEPGAAGALVNVAAATYRLGRPAEAIPLFERSVATYERLGRRAEAATALSTLGLALQDAGRDADARAALQRSLALREALSDRAGVASTLFRIGTLRRADADPASARAALDRALALQTALGDRRGGARTLQALAGLQVAAGEPDAAAATCREALERLAGVEHAEADRASVDERLGEALHVGGRRAEAQAAYQRALDAYAAAEDPVAAARVRASLGVVRAAQAAYDDALALYAQAAAAQEALGDLVGLAATQRNLGNLHALRGDAARAKEAFARALATARAARDERAVTRTRLDAAVAALETGDRRELAAELDEIRRAFDAIGSRRESARATMCLGVLELRGGDAARALETLRGALAQMEAVGDRFGAAQALSNTASALSDLGDYAGAISARERALDAQLAIGARADAAATLGNLAALYGALGDVARAVDTAERSLAMTEQLGDRAESAANLLRIGVARYVGGDLDGARAAYERALALCEAAGRKDLAVSVLSALGGVEHAQGRHTEALATFGRALALARALDAPEEIAEALQGVGVARAALGDARGALDDLDAASRVASGAGLRSREAAALGAIGAVRASRGEHRAALSLARRSLELAASLDRGLSAEEGSHGRVAQAHTVDYAVLAARDVGDPAEVLHFVEWQRARALLRGLSSGAVTAAIPSALLRDEADARRAEAVAAEALRRAGAAGDLATTRARRADLDAARDRVSAVVSRIQREERSASSVAYPAASTLEDVRATLAREDVLVLYAPTESETVALVVTSSEARVVSVGASSAIEDAVAGLSLGAADGDPADAVATLRRLAVEPLGLPADRTRVLVAPAGALCVVPFAMLLPGRTVVHVPSASTYRLLREVATERGRGVLALGDPDYASVVDERALALHRGSTARLSRLPASRDEVRAVGDVTLLGAEATESRLRAELASRERWRAVHLACHGLVDPERPARSSLAITASKDDDGFVTCLDVFRMRVPADLVVLSACETGRGRVVRGEGVVGLARAFMLAGAPRVVCSLWKVDDAATAALMREFYARWNPKDGTPGPTAADALRAAQEHVRSHDRWKHPYYWAAWVLWGAP